MSTAAPFVPGPEHREVVFLTGSGLSARTGLGTFRGPEGLWALEPETEQAMHASLLPTSLPLEKSMPFILLAAQVTAPCSRFVRGDG